LKKKIRAQFISPEKQRGAAQRFLFSQGRGCEWAEESLGGKKMFVDGQSRDKNRILGCACCFVAGQSRDNLIKNFLGLGCTCHGYPKSIRICNHIDPGK
jgi:hypothetical protein